MLYFVDFYLGTFLILCGFALSLLNLRRIVKCKKLAHSAVLLSENLLLTCIGIAFIGRSLYKLSPVNTEMNKIEERSGNIMKTEEINCSFTSIIMGYGPLIISLVNSFLSLIIDNYLQYKLLTDMKNEEENEVREVNDSLNEGNGTRLIDIKSFIKKYFAFFIVVIQWILPILAALPMYSIDIKEMTIIRNERDLSDDCMALLDVQKNNCSKLLVINNTVQLQEYMSENYLDVPDFELNNTTEKKQINNVIDNIYNILTKLQNETYHSDVNLTTTILFRQPKNYINQKCMKICYLENKNLLLYIFGVFVISYFVPITISTIILTKIHTVRVNNQALKPHVNRELFYNILFWTPVMFDTFLSITVCRYTMNGMRTSIFNIIANVYQAVKNFMNITYFKDNTVLPI